MRIVVRIFGLTIIGVLVSITIIHTFSINIHLDELEKISSLAMSNTQIVMQETVEDRLFGTNNARRKIESDEEYIALYKDNLNKLISTESEYRIADYYVDYYKGLIYVDVICEYKTLFKETKYLEKKLINIIDVIE